MKDTPISEMYVELARELYDRFVMGGWEPQDSYEEIDRIVSKHLIYYREWLALGGEKP